jgi:hypothetical protein
MVPDIFQDAFALIYIGLKHQGEIPLDYQYILKKMKSKKAKIGLFLGRRLPVGWEWA